jgi:hypothetical protein
VGVYNGLLEKKHHSARKEAPFCSKRSTILLEKKHHSARKEALFCSKRSTILLEKKHHSARKEAPFCLEMSSEFSISTIVLLLHCGYLKCQAHSWNGGFSKLKPKA